MTNVYDRLNDFYLKNPDAKFYFQRKIFERHLRKCAWKGDDKSKLNLRFELLSRIVLFAIEIDLDSICDLVPEDYLEIFYELSDIENKNLDEKTVLKYIKFVKELFLEREPDGFEGNIEEIEFLRMFFYDEGKFHLLKRENKNSYKSCIRRDKTSYEEMRQIEFLKENWLVKIKEYFNNSVFEKDLKRALTMFINGKKKYEKNEESEKKFRDYFLFNYRLIRTDETPLEFFYKMEKENLDDISTQIIEEYLNSKFTIFYVKREDGDSFLCRDFFREREFFIPYSSADFPEYKSIVFSANIEEGTIVAPAFLNAIFAEEGEMDKIVKEIKSAYKLYAYQEKNPTYAKFFARHNMAVRQIIAEVAVFHKTDVIPEAIDIENIKSDLNLTGDYEKPINKLINIAKKIELSEYSIKLLKKYYSDFLTKSKFTRWQNENDLALFAVLKNFSELNGAKNFYKIDEYFPPDLDIEKLQIMSTDIKNLLKSETFDPRYLTEEGFFNLVCS